MKTTISNKIQFGTTLNPLDVGYIPSVDDEANLENLYSKLDKIGEFWKNGKADDNLARSIANLTELSRQNQVACILPRKRYAFQTYSDLKNLEFIIELYLFNFQKKPTKTAQLDDTMITVITVLDIGLKILTYSNIRMIQELYRLIAVQMFIYSAQQLTYFFENL